MLTMTKTVPKSMRSCEKSFELRDDFKVGLLGEKIIKQFG
jgi:hypothetical protein